MDTKDNDDIQVLGSAQLIKSDKLPEAITDMLSKHRNIIQEVELVLPSIEGKPEVKAFLEKRLQASKNTVKVLEKGFVPVLVDSPISLKPKTPSILQELKEMMVRLPQEAKDALERAKKLNIFDQFAISGGPRGGDPVIVGVIGSKFFLIAAWVNVDGGGSVGYTFKHNRLYFPGYIQA